MKAWELFKSSKNWCQHDFAQNVRGYPVESTGTAATRWCAAGAIRKIYNLNSTETMFENRKLIDYIENNTGFNEISTWNDNKHQRWNRVRDVLKKLDI